MQTDLASGTDSDSEVQMAEPDSQQQPCRFSLCYLHMPFSHVLWLISYYFSWIVRAEAWSCVFGQMHMFSFDWGF